MQLPLILAIDNDKDLRRFFHELLPDEGYQVLSAANGAEALELLDSLRRVNRQLPDLIILDICMPVMDGAAFMRAYGQTAGQAPVLALSADTLDQHAALGDTHVAEFLQKPFDLGELLAIVAVLLARPPGWLVADNAGPEERVRVAVK